MPFERLPLDDLITGKMKRVIWYNKSLIGQTFGEGYEGGRNRLAKIVVFKVNLSKLSELILQI